MDYVDSHEWIVIDQGIGTVGIKESTRKELGEIVFAQLPEVGSFVKKEEEVCVLESTKAAFDIYSPAAGEVIAVNDLSEGNIEKVNRSPEKEGWLFKIKIAEASL